MSAAPALPQTAPTAARAETLRAALDFIVPQRDKPFFESSALTGGEPRLHFATEQRVVEIRDMRPLAAGLSLDVNGFELHRHATTVSDFYDDDALRDVYDRELQTLLRTLTGADRVVVFDYTRRSDAAAGAANADGPRRPASRAHVDYTVKSGPQRAADTIGARAVERALGRGGRIVQLNVWRPISGPVRRSPLAVADASSVPAATLIATEQRFPDRVGEIYQLAYHQDQRWYWAPSMLADEVLLLKGWDSLDDGRARFTPHSAFRLPVEDADAPPRESIEARVYLLFDDAA